MLMIPGIGPSFSGGRRGEATGARVVGTVVDAVTGRPVSGARVIVSPRALDLGAHVSRYLLGELSETAFREPLLGRARTNFRGELTLTGIPPGGPYRLAAFAARYRPAVITFRAGRDGPVDVGTVRLTR
jgi:protocatechuate 3,4-dioxygenase beta subunit